jgi:hypothetical protein
MKFIKRIHNSMRELDIGGSTYSKIQGMPLIEAKKMLRGNHLCWPMGSGFVMVGLSSLRL